MKFISIKNKMIRTMEAGNLEQIIVRCKTKNLESIMLNVNKGVQKERNR